MRTQRNRRRAFTRKLSLVLLIAVTLMLGGCNANVGVGMSVGVPIGNNGYMSVGTGRWF
jgi:predicted small secreted protein